MSLTHYTIYKVSDGGIAFNVFVPEGSASCSTGHDIVEGEYSRVDYYCPSGTPTLKTVATPTKTPSSIPADGTTECVITGLPNPCDIMVRMPDLTIAYRGSLTGGTLTLTSTMAGKITIDGERWPDVKPFKVEVTVT